MYLPRLAWDNHYEKVSHAYTSSYFVITERCPPLPYLPEVNAGIYTGDLGRRVNMSCVPDHVYPDGSRKMDLICDIETREWSTLQPCLGETSLWITGWTEVVFCLLNITHQRWNHLSPRILLDIECPEPPAVNSSITNWTGQVIFVGGTVEYSCLGNRRFLDGRNQAVIRCDYGGVWNQTLHQCKGRQWVIPTLT